MGIGNIFTCATCGLSGNAETLNLIKCGVLDDGGADENFNLAVALLEEELRMCLLEEERVQHDFVIAQRELEIREQEENADMQRGILASMMLPPPVPVKQDGVVAVDAPVAPVVPEGDLSPFLEADPDVFRYGHLALGSSTSRGHCRLLGS